MSVVRNNLQMRQEIKKYIGCLRGMAFNPVDSKGRKSEYDEDSVYSEVMDPFALDIQKIKLSKAYRRLGNKKQVVISRRNSHIRTRLTHTLEVVDASIKLALIIGLNRHLVHAIAEGHDCGHTPYGHVGESFLRKITGKPFRHNIFGSVVLQYFERKGKGLNLTFETLQGITMHSRSDGNLFLSDNVPEEYNVVMYMDKLAYTLADVNDMIRFYGWSENDFPKELKELGYDQRERMLNCILALVSESASAGYIVFDKTEVAEQFKVVRKFMYEKAYPCVDVELEWVALKRAYEYIGNNPLFRGIDPAVVLALMGDSEVDVFLKNRYMSDKNLLKDAGVMELTPYIKRVNWTIPCLDWVENRT